jgi:poly-gamma-glutamate capsule biosynthesis protein CapA/YwtB (metallophosphatase superfamily)/outer membrane protein assembly factor BamB
VVTRHLLPVVLLLVACTLVSCGLTPTPPVAVVRTDTPSPSATSVPTYTPIPTRLLTRQPTLIPSATPQPTPTSTPQPVPTLSPSPTPSPSPPLLLTPVAGEPEPLSLDWWFNANGHLTAGGVVQLADQPAFVLASLGRTVYALDESGGVRWQVRTPGPVYALAFLDGERLAAGDDAGFVTLLDAGGRRLWRYDLGGRVTVLHRGWQDGLLAGGWDERLTFLDDGGEVRWQVDLGGPVSGLVVLPGQAFASTLDGMVLASGPTGSEVWRFDAGAPITGLGALGEGEDAFVLAGTQDGRLLALDSEGTLRWQRVLGSGGPIWHAADLEGDGMPEILAGTGGDEPLLALLSASGEIRWRMAVPSPVGALLALDLDGDGTMEILAGLADGEILVYDQRGRQRGAVHAGLSVWGLEAAADGPAGPNTDRAALVLADVVAWRIAGEEGSVGASWLPAPATLPMPPPVPLPGIGRVEGEAILVFLGDVAPGRSMEAQLARFGPAYPWLGLQPLLREADLAVANLECVLTTQGKPLDKPYLLRAHPRWGETLVEGGFDLVTLANNHGLDYGNEGLAETMDTLAALGVAYVGAGRSREEAHAPALFDLNGVRIAVLGYAAARWNGSVDVPATDRLAWAEPAAVEADVRAVRDRADLVVVLLHAGTEYAAEPSSDQVRVAHAAIDAGADLVVGHHPHVAQTVERYGRGLIVYSLGNTLFDIPRPATMRGHLLRVHATQAGLVRAELWPFWIEDAIRPRLLDDGQGAPRIEVVVP